MTNFFTNQPLTGFAKGITVTTEGWYDWQVDTPFRRQHFPEEGIGHPAKANLHMLLDLQDYLTTTGETIYDPFGGVGSQLISTLFGRNVILTEVEDGYFNLECMAWEELRGAASGQVLLIQSDNRLVMPFPEGFRQWFARSGGVFVGNPQLGVQPVDHIITSPPYSNVLATPYSTLRASAEKDESRAAVLSGYSENSPGNLGILPTFQYNQQMERVYRGMASSLRVGGTVTVLIKDFFIQGKRNYLSKWVDRTFLGMGFMEQLVWVKRRTRGLSSNDRKSRGLEAIEDEDLMVYRRIK
jgi:DNA modification methylase